MSSIIFLLFHFLFDVAPKACLILSMKFLRVGCHHSTTQNKFNNNWLRYLASYCQTLTFTRSDMKIIRMRNNTLPIRGEILADWPPIFQSANPPIFLPSKIKSFWKPPILNTFKFNLNYRSPKLFHEKFNQLIINSIMTFSDNCFPYNFFRTGFWRWKSQVPENTYYLIWINFMNRASFAKINPRENFENSRFAKF